MIVAPYLLAAPLLFADEPAKRITLGTLVQVSFTPFLSYAPPFPPLSNLASARLSPVQTSNSFGKVFSSLSIVSENWG